MVAGALLVTSLSVAAMPLVPDPYGLWAATIVFGGGLAVLGWRPGLYIFTLAGYSTGALVGIYRLSGDVMQVFGPIVIGPMVDEFGFRSSFLLMGGFGLLALLSMALRTGGRAPARSMTGLGRSKAATRSLSTEIGLICAPSVASRDVRADTPSV